MKRRPRSLLYPHQERLARKIVDTKAILLNVPMGLGKTATVLTALVDIFVESPQARALIVAPKRVATNVWPNEILDWEHTEGIRFSVIEGSPKKRADLVKRRAQIDIINFENLKWLHEHAKTSYDVVIIDESSRLRSGKKKTSTSGGMSTFGAAAKFCEQASRRILLTGTLAPNGIHGLWGQAFCLDQGQRLGKTRSAFERRWFDKDYMGWNLTPTPAAEKEITALLSDVVFTLNPDEKVKLPDVVESNITVTLPPVARVAYSDLKRTLVSLPHDVSAISSSALKNKLLQLCNGACYREDGTVAEIHTEKLDALEELYLELNREPLIVLYQYKFDLKQIRLRFPESRTLADNGFQESEWNKGNIRMLLAHPKSCAHGLNLQFGGNRIVWYGLTWDLELYKQANARTARPGQKNEKCYVHHILARDTDEHKVLARLNEKDATQSRVEAVFLEY